MYPQTGVDTPARMMTSMFAESFKAELKEWRDSAPTQLASNRAHNNAFGSPEWFELMYHHSVLLLYRHSMISQHRSALGDAAGQPSVYLECASSAQAICRLYRQLYMSQRLNDTWGALHLLFLGGVTFLYCLWTSPEARRAFRLDRVSSTCTSCVVVLAVMAERWRAVEPYRDTFEMLADWTQTMLAEVEAAVVPEAMPVFPSSSNDQLSDNLLMMTEIGMCSSVEALLTDMIN